MSLPQEIVDHIFDYLQDCEDSYASLRRGCLVCHSWKRSARRHIFSTIYLAFLHDHSQHAPGVFTLDEDEDCLAAEKRLIHVFEQNAEIAGCVKTVHITCNALTEVPIAEDPEQLVRWHYSQKPSMDSTYDDYASPPSSVDECPKNHNLYGDNRLG